MVVVSYKLAEKLSDRLDEMGKDLKSMIEEINSASLTLNKTNKADDPVRSPSRVDISSEADRLPLAFSDCQGPQQPSGVPTVDRSKHRSDPGQGIDSSKGRTRIGYERASWARGGRRGRLLPILPG